MPGLKLYTSNRLAALAGELSETLRRAPASPMTPEVILVQSRGMERWLSLELARRLGICANIRFPFPNHFVEELFLTVLPELPGSAAFDPEVLAWRIMDLLPRCLDGEGFEPLKVYLADDGRGLKRYLVGYQEIMNRVSAWFPNTRPLDRSAFTPVAHAGPGWDLTEMLGLQDVISEEDLSLDPRSPRRARVVRPPAEVRPKHWNDGLIITEVDDPSLPRLVMLRDSFTSALVPFLAEHFRRAVFYWRSDFDTDTILEEHADLVIMEFGGRTFYRLVAFNPDEVTASAAAPTTQATQR